MKLYTFHKKFGKSGLSPQAIPLKDLGLKSEGRSVPTKWLIDNWQDWAYGEASIDDVYVLKNYPMPIWPPEEQPKK